MKQRHSLDDLLLFHAVAQHRSLRAAAAGTGIPIATLSRRLQNLERSLGCRLLERSAHHFALTEIGHDYFNACGPLLEELNSVTEHLEESRIGLHGTLRITAPVNLTQQWLGPCFFDFMRRFPSIHLQLQISNHNENLVEQQLDAAIRVGTSHNTLQWIARPIASTKLILCAATHYLQQAQPILHPVDLSAHQLLVVNPINEWNLNHQISNENYTFRPQPYFQSNEIQIALNAASQGFGVTLLPDYYLPVDPAAEQPLQRVLPEWCGQSRPIYLLYRDKHTMSARLRLFVDHVVEWMERRNP